MRLFIEQALTVGNTLDLDTDKTHRLQKVMRARVGEALTVFNGGGGEYTATLVAMTKKSATLELTHFIDIERESPFKVTLIQGISRGNRMDYTIQKSVELGVNQIIPVATTRSMVKLDEQRQASRLDHWMGVIHHACEQCGRNTLPKLNEPLALKDIARLANIEQAFFLDTQSDLALNAATPPSGSCYIIAGPEGGFSDTEREWIRNLGVSAIKLGPRILRTETAALAALSVMQQLWGDLSGE